MSYFKNGLFFDLLVGYTIMLVFGIVFWSTLCILKIDQEKQIGLNVTGLN